MQCAAPLSGAGGEGRPSECEHLVLLMQDLGVYGECGSTRVDFHQAKDGA